MSPATHPLPEPPATPRPSIVDGNALIGILEEAFGAATATLGLTCGSCADSSALSDSAVELAPTSAIVRCRRCTHTILTLRWSEQELVIDGRAGRSQCSAGRADRGASSLRRTVVDHAGGIGHRLARRLHPLADLRRGRRVSA